MNANDDADDINTESKAREFCDNNDSGATYSCNEIRRDVFDSNNSNSRSSYNHSSNIGKSDYSIGSNNRNPRMNDSPVISLPVETHETKNPTATGEGSSVSHGSSRLFTLELSPCNEKASCLYEIRNDGIFGLR